MCQTRVGLSLPPRLFEADFGLPMPALSPKSKKNRMLDQAHAQIK